MNGKKSVSDDIFSLRPIASDRKGYAIGAVGLLHPLARRWRALTAEFDRFIERSLIVKLGSLVLLRAASE